jgi:hypothetical protein
MRMTSCRRLFPIIGLAAALAVAACSSDQLRVARGRIELNPTVVSFGDVSLHTIVESFVEVRNTGTASLTVRAFDFKGTNRPNDASANRFDIANVLTTNCDGSPRDGGASVGVQECARFAVRFRPFEVGKVSAELTLTTDDPQSPSVVLAVSGRGVEGNPSCDAASTPSADIVILDGVRDITGLPVVRNQAAVTFDGTGSNFKGEEGAYAWRLVSAPDFGVKSFSGTDTGRAELVPQLDGTYEVELVVTNKRGCRSARNVTLTVSSDGGVHIEVTWKESHGDVDLHYIRPNGTFADRSTNTDCFYANCRRDDYFYDIEWGGPEGSDPLLDADKVWGNGPENVTVDKPTDGLYSVVAHYYCARDRAESNDEWGDYSGLAATSSGPATVTAKVFFFGRLVHTVERSLTQRDLWRIGWVKVDGGLPAFVHPGDVGAPNLPEVEKTPTGETAAGYRYACTDDGY